jgi:hypothetical protein
MPEYARQKIPGNLRARLLYQALVQAGLLAQANITSGII